jgi:hypothetical protein
MNTVLRNAPRSTHTIGSRALLWAVLAVIALSVAIAGCRRDRVWSGVQYDHTGRVLKFAASEPFCGCLDAINVSSKPIFLRARAIVIANDPPIMERGHVILAPNEELKAQFDWAGPALEDVFELDAWSEDGHPLVTRDVLRGVAPSWPYEPCDTHICKMGSLYMNTGTIYQH